MIAQERLAKDRSYENHVDNTNMGKQAILDKDNYENSMIRIKPTPGSRDPGSIHDQ